MEEEKYGFEVLYEEYSEDELYAIYTDVVNCYDRLIKSEEITKELVETRGKKFHDLNNGVKEQYLSFITFCERRLKPNREVTISEVNSQDIESRLKEQRDYEVSKFENAINELIDNDGLRIDIQDCSVTIYKIYKEYDDIFYSYVDNQSNDYGRTF